MKWTKRSFARGKKAEQRAEANLESRDENDTVSTDLLNLKRIAIIVIHVIIFEVRCAAEATPLVRAAPRVVKLFHLVQFDILALIPLEFHAHLLILVFDISASDLRFSSTAFSAWACCWSFRDYSAFLTTWASQNQILRNLHVPLGSASLQIVTATTPSPPTLLQQPRNKNLRRAV